MNTQITFRATLAMLFSAALMFGGTARAAFHFMQIEQVIGGVNGDTSAQAVQLRMRSFGQSVLANASLRTVDAAGANEILLDNMGTNVANNAAGSRVLITTPNFANYTDIPLVSDFTMDPIPLSYLAAGQLTFENSSGSITYWSLSWGGAGFTGSTTANSGVTNDDDGDFGPPVNDPLPSDSLSALLFQGAAADKSTTNLADYALTAGAATFTNNAGTDFTLVAPAVDSADFDNDGDVDGLNFLTWQRNTGGPGSFAQGDANNNGNIDGDDLAVWEEQFGTVPPLAGIVAVPEPQTLGLLAVCRVVGAALRSRRRQS